MGYRGENPVLHTSDKGSLMSDAKSAILNAIEEAAKDAAAFLTVDLRDHQAADGWHPDVVAATTVSYEDRTFSANIDAEQSDQGFIHEYGNGTVLPTATIRKYGMNADVAEKALIATLSDKLEGLL